MVWVRFASDARRVRERALMAVGGVAVFAVGLRMHALWDGGQFKTFDDGFWMWFYLILGPALSAVSGYGLLVDLGRLPRAWVKRADDSLRLKPAAGALRGESLTCRSDVPVRVGFVSKSRSGLLFVGSRVTLTVSAAEESVSIVVVTSELGEIVAALKCQLRAAGFHVE